MDNTTMEQVQYHIDRWRETATNYGWGDEFDDADITVWVDSRGQVVDSVATKTGGRTLRVLPYEEGCDVEDCTEC